MIKFQYIQDQPPQTTSPFDGVNPFLADALYDSMVGAQVNVCAECGVVQESIDGVLLPWSEFNSICQECEADYAASN